VSAWFGTAETDEGEREEGAAKNKRKRGKEQGNVRAIKLRSLIYNEITWWCCFLLLLCFTTSPPTL